MAGFDAIVADVRANQARLLDYVGTAALVVQYQTGDGTLDVGPYPSRFRRDRATA